MFYWSKFQPSAMLSKSHIFAAEASISLLNKDYASARDKIVASRTELPNMLDRGVGIALADKLKELESRITLYDTPSCELRKILLKYN